MKHILLHNEQDTKKLAQDIAASTVPRDVFLLTGDLGAGKTTFTKGFALGLGIQQMIKSPTYTLIREYDTGRIPLYHMDVYRLTEGAEDLGLEDYFDGDGVCIIEWGKMIKQNIDVPYLEFFLDKIDETTRSFSIAVDSPDSQNKLDSLVKYLTDKGWLFDGL
ncbi:tRNA (adenosine(37)-N6)-threonylcarbamoyltransferase complex ATPase subunit type 1 TsaE [Vagococcus vulneris]|uniref:tRNA threonylcarbamoyladenosine biosynthesis protein TsaE n=1 Tax=Vagococcus vulneris TaxID=1977869 RepID=A0A430A0B5_9ENTE|nr:tRNA (adenosine(37)-N6)-threonylcarbamoyltransferase complex ATPase subunit type 1 TsaE [Vagococcus vulneris]RST99779.1 tRNA (adenosine(37)-N6)-threonylcarbamoyltransferase complex ATPase subunit type 1 TsaE [Vagococcus vulneris]